MKFYAAKLTKPVTLSLVQFRHAAESPHEFPAGTQVSATPAGDGRWHLNHNPKEFETWDGYASDDELEVGQVIATANEGK